MPQSPCYLLLGKFCLEEKVLRLQKWRMNRWLQGDGAGWWVWLSEGNARGPGVDGHFSCLDCNQCRLSCCCIVLEDGTIGRNWIKGGQCLC